MRRILCMFILSLLYLEVNAQLGYWYKNDFIKLIPVRDSVLFVQTNEDLSAVCKDAIANKELKVVLKASKNQYIVKSEKKYLPVKSYTSVFYKHNNESNEVVILPQIVFSVSDEAVKNTILKQYQGILSISNKVKNIYEMECDLSSSDEVLLLAMQIAQIKGVNWCEPNKMFGYNNSNPLYANQFYLKNTDNSGVDINVEPAWNIVNVNTNIKVAVIDCGVDKNHEDLYSNIIDGYTVNDSNSKGGCILSNTSHGTACAGIVGAINNSIGIRGVASGVKIMPINVTTGYLNYMGNDIYCSESEIANAIIWAVDNGADVLSCSWIGGYVSSYIESAIDYARSEGRNGKGTIVVFAAGNNYPNTPNVSFPASYSGTIAVGAVDRYGTICSYSQRGPALDLVAPSNQILSVGEIYTTCKTNTGNINNNYTSSFGGTSAACPQVAGVAALILSARPDFTETQVRTVLQQTAKDLGTTGFDTTYGYGLVDAGHAVFVAKNYIISGQQYICNSSTATYTINNLPSVCSVNWYLSDGFGPTAPTLQSSGSTCTITNNLTSSYMGTLHADIYYQGALYKSCQQQIVAYGGFYGLVTTTNQQFSPSSPVWVAPGSIVALKSPNLVQKNVSYSVVNPSAWQYYASEGGLTVGYPSGSSAYQPIVISIQNNTLLSDCDNSYQILIMPTTVLPHYQIQAGGDNGNIMVELTTETDEEAKKVIQAYSIPIEIEQNPTWTLEVFDAASGTKLITKNVTGTSAVVATGKSRGVFVVRATIGKEVLSEKVVLR